MEMFAGAGMGEMDQNLREMLGNMLPTRTKVRKVRVSEARRLLVQEETQKLIDMDEVASQAVRRVQDSGIVFLDEIDKIAGRERGQGPDVSREGVQRDLLPIVEGTAVTTKYGVVRTDHILFVAAGAFHVAKPSDLIPELQGRFPIRVELEPLSRADFVRILTEPESALIKQYTALLRTEGVTLDFTAGRRGGRGGDRHAGERAHREHRRPPALHDPGARPGGGLLPGARPVRQDRDGRRRLRARPGWRTPSATTT